MRPFVKLVVPAAALAVLASAAPLATASTTRADAPAPTATLRGSVLPSVAHSALVAPTPATAAVHVSLVLKPSHPKLLATLAAQASGQAGLSQRVMDGLFRPSAIVRAQVAAYMRAHGFRPAGNGMLTMSFTGAAAQAESAFGVSLNHYRLPSGTGYRAPSGAIHLPPALARRVISVDGLSTLPLMHPLGLHRVHHKAGVARKPQISTSDCGTADTMQGANPGSLQPADLAGANAYNSQPLLTVNDDGTGESVALVEFSGYHPGDLHGLPDVLRHDRPEHPGQRERRHATEHERRQHRGRARPGGAGGRGTRPEPHLHLRRAAVVLDGRACSTRSTAHHTSEGVHIVSDSWGNCEVVLLEADAGGEQPRAAADGRCGHVVLRRVGRRRVVRLPSQPRDQQRRGR